MVAGVVVGTFATAGLLTAGFGAVLLAGTFVVVADCDGSTFAVPDDSFVTGAGAAGGALAGKADDTPSVSDLAESTSGTLCVGGGAAATSGAAVVAPPSGGGSVSSAAATASSPATAPAMITFSCASIGRRAGGGAGADGAGVGADDMRISGRDLPNIAPGLVPTRWHHANGAFRELQSSLSCPQCERHVNFRR